MLQVSHTALFRSFQAPDVSEFVAQDAKKATPYVAVVEAGETIVAPKVSPTWESLGKRGKIDEDWEYVP